MTPTSHDDALVRWIDGHAEELIALTRDFVRVPSVSGTEGTFAHRVADWAGAKGLETELRCIPEEFRDRYPDFSREMNLPERPNLYVRLRSPEGRDAPAVVLNGHLDVVPVGDLSRWRFDPFAGERADGAIWGRGSADMKGPVAAGLMAVLALRECSVPLAADVHVHLVIGEETGGLGTLFALSHEPPARGEIVLEPSQSRIVVAGGGSVQFTVRATGKAAHGCAPWEGRSALNALVACLHRLEAYAERRNATLSHPLFKAFPQPAPLSVGTFFAGEWRATVPEGGELSGRIGALPGEDLNAIREDIKAEIEACRKALGMGPADLTVDWPNQGFPAWQTPAATQLVEALQSAAAATGQDDTLTGVTFGSDAGHIAQRDVPVAIYGPGNIAVAHMVDEHISEVELVEACKTLALALARLAG